MKLFGLNVIEHKAVPEEEAWIIRNKEAQALPPELQDIIQVPCIVTGSLALLRETVILMRLTNMAEDAIITEAPRQRRARCRESRGRVREQRRRAQSAAVR